MKFTDVSNSNIYNFLYPKKGIYNSTEVVLQLIEEKYYILEKRSIILKNKKYLLKELIYQDPYSLVKKLEIISHLIKWKSRIDIVQLVFPEKIATFNEDFIGYIMPYIENNKNLYEVLTDKNTNITDKINFLKQVGNILEKINKVNQKSNINFWLNDIHEGNFVINLDDNKIHVIDLDSSVMFDSVPFPSKYLIENNIIENFKEKYPLDKEDRNIPSYNTDLFCYIIMILNTLAQDRVDQYSIGKFNDYLEKLSIDGYPIELLNIFKKIYSNEDNINPYSMLDYIPNYSKILSK